MAQLTDPEHPGAVTLTHHVDAGSVEEAVAEGVRQGAREAGRSYGGQACTAWLEVTEESPSSQLRQQEEARRRYLATILENAGRLGARP
ncbi:hypothetical protein [Streptomyces angustmyceticus]|uniref:hypothetical protein n=1 Tax=Streptomyces angustmyceticus TaxID=285578 RepID=UPI003D8AC9D0